MPPFPYELVRQTAYEWTEKAFELQVAGDLTVTVVVREGVHIATAIGECPRCEHNVSFSLELDAPATDSVGGLGGVDALTNDYVPVTAMCRCEGDHPGRPDSVSVGCGILFNAEVRVSP